MGAAMTLAAPPIVRTVTELRVQVAAWKTAGERVALVPTMGGLHEGHLALVRRAGELADRVVTSLFVNPTQFAPGEDFEAYPRDEARDAALLAAQGCDLLYAPGAGEMYPAGFSTTVTVAEVSSPLDGLSRPRHFAGVATVVSKLLNQCAPDVAVFGEKDYQQLLVIRRLVRDLDMPVEITGLPTVRDADGLALSSRNAYLSPDERAVAGQLNLVIKAAAQSVRGGEAVAAVEARALAALAKAGIRQIDYLEVRGADDLARLGPGPTAAPARVFVAARLGKTRLIDNWPV
jgi:pantoate--beta-alanine ligase